MPFPVNVAPGPGWGLTRVGVHVRGNGGQRSGVFVLGHASVSMYELMIECNCPQEYPPWMKLTTNVIGSYVNKRQDKRSDRVYLNYWPPFLQNILVLLFQY